MDFAEATRKSRRLKLLLIGISYVIFVLIYYFCFNLSTVQLPF